MLPYGGRGMTTGRMRRFVGSRRRKSHHIRGAIIREIPTPSTSSSTTTMHGIPSLQFPAAAPPHRGGWGMHGRRVGRVVGPGTGEGRGSRVGEVIPSVAIVAKQPTTTPTATATAVVVRGGGRRGQGWEGRVGVVVVDGGKGALEAARGGRTRQDVVVAASWAAPAVFPVVHFQGAFVVVQVHHHGCLACV